MDLPTMKIIQATSTNEKIVIHFPDISQLQRIRGHGRALIPSFRVQRRAQVINGESW
jgi:hypothetical protein